MALNYHNKYQQIYYDMSKEEMLPSDQSREWSTALETLQQRSQLRSESLVLPIKQSYTANHSTALTNFQLQKAYSWNNDSILHSDKMDACTLIVK